MDVSFREERLGGEADDPVRFRVALLSCEIAVILPVGETKLAIDPRSIASDQKCSVVSRSLEHVSGHSAEGAIALKTDLTGMSGGVEGKISGSKSTTDTVTIRGETPLLLGQRSRTNNGDLSWIITRADGSGVLDQVVWDAKNEPRFDLIDNRDATLRQNDMRTQLHPTIRVEIHCRSEDLQIKDITLTDPEERKVTALWAGERKRKKAAEAFIKRALLTEGLHAGNIHDPYGRLIVGDMIVSLIDDVQL